MKPDIESSHKTGQHSSTCNSFAYFTTGLRSLYSWQEKLAEVEFLYDANGEALPLEVKSGWVTHAKSAKIFAEKYHSPYRVTFSAKPLRANQVLHSYPLYLAERFPLQD